MDNWNEIRTAAYVARLGTISAAADALGVHRATVNRHIDMLETELGGKLFQRHARGFTATELGQELLRIADATDEQFGQLHRLANKHSVELKGELVVTSLEFLAPQILPLLATFRAKHQGVKTRFISSADVMKLEYGEAHIAFRAGPKPQDPDNVVQLFAEIDVGLYASKTYVAQYGIPSGVEDFGRHHFVGSPKLSSRVPTAKWMQDNVPDHAFAFHSNQMSINQSAVFAGNGIGILPCTQGQSSPDLVEIMPPKPEWRTMAWTVTHVDLHRSPKIQAFMDVMREARETAAK